MCNKKKYIWRVVIIIAVALLLPVILNFVVGLERPNNISVVGYPETWIGFYGSYIGGVLTALIGFLTLWQTSKNNDKKLRIAYQKSIVENLERTLAQCVSLFNFPKIVAVALYISKGKTTEPNIIYRIQQDLNEYCCQITETANAWYTVYNGREEQEIKDFQRSYKQCVDYFLDKINEMTKIIKSLDMPISEDVYARINTFINTGSKQAGILLADLLDKASAWLDLERANLRKIQEC